MSESTMSRRQRPWAWPGRDSAAGSIPLPPPTTRPICRAGNSSADWSNSVSPKAPPIEVLHEGAIGRDPIAVRVNAATVALRRREAMAILVI